jgi:hypothetical protein
VSVNPGHRSPPEHAEAAAEAFAEVFADGLMGDVRILKSDAGTLKSDVNLLKWMLGFVLAFQIGIFVKLFMH